MAKKSLFGRLAKALKEPEEKSIEDIDKEVEAAVMATMSMKVGALDGMTVLRPGTGEMGDTAYVFDLAPIYEMIGGRQSRAAAGVLEICDRQFKAFSEHPQDIAVVKGDHYIMRFARVRNEEGYRRSVLIINEIGGQLLSEQFQKIDVPEILVAANINDITNANGEVKTEQIQDVQKKGGLPVDFNKLGDVPVWAKMVVRKNVKRAWEFMERTKSRNDDIKMVEIKHDKAIKYDDVKFVEVRDSRKEIRADWFEQAMKADGSEKKFTKRSPQDRLRKK